MSRRRNKGKALRKRCSRLRGRVKDLAGRVAESASREIEARVRRADEESRAVASLQAALRDAQREVKRLTEAERLLTGFRAAIRKMPFTQGRYFAAGDVFALQVTFCPREIEYALLGDCDSPVNLSYRVDALVHQVAAQCRRAILEQVQGACGGASGGTSGGAPASARRERIGG